MVSVPLLFLFFYDTNNLLKNRITSGMHIYSSPRILSVNLGSVSTKHEQHLLPNRLYPQQIWHHVHSFLSLFPFRVFFPLFTFHISFQYIYYFGILSVSAGLMLEVNNKTCSPSLQIQLRSCSILPLHSQTTPPLNEVHMPVCACVCLFFERVCACVMVPGHLLSRAGGV